jgi:hypothetical protein
MQRAMLATTLLAKSFADRFFIENPPLFRFKTPPAMLLQAACCAALEVMAEKSDQKDDGNRNADEIKEYGSHVFLLS